jgi:hypothetical protein
MKHFVLNAGFGLRVLKSAAWALPFLALSSCFEAGDGYENVVIPGVVFEIDSLPGDTLYFGPQKSSQTVLIKTNQRDWTSYVVSGRDFCAARKAGGVSVSVDENEMIATRAAEISLRAGGQSYRIYVLQKEAEPFLQLNMSRVEFDSAAVASDTVKVAARTNFEWTPASSEAWCVVGKQAAPDDAFGCTISVTVDGPNSGAAPRTAEITFSSTEYAEVAAARKITVTQK